MRTQSDVTIEHASLIYDGDRSLYLSGTRALWAYYKNSVLPAELGETLLYVYSKYEFLQGSTTFDSVFFTEKNGESYISVKLGPTWCVRKNLSSLTSNFTFGAQHPRDLSEDELLTYIYTFCASHTLEDFADIVTGANANNSSVSSSDKGCTVVRVPDERSLYTFPGDICAVLRPRLQTSETSICLLIASHIWREEGRIGERIVWINKDTLQSKLYDMLKSSPLLTSTSSSTDVSTKYQLFRFLR